MSQKEALKKTGGEPLLTLADVRAAAARIGDAVVHTPTDYSKTLSQITGANIWLKFENLQFTAAYKERGALNKLLLLTEEQKARGVITASAGNHSQGLAYHGTRLGRAGHDRDAAHHADGEGDPDRASGAVRLSSRVKPSTKPTNTPAAWKSS